MKIDHKFLRARSWAIPALSGILVLHHDFTPARFVDVTQISWKGAGALDVHLTYGMCNVSGQVTESLELVASLESAGSVSLAPVGAPTVERAALTAFLAGEVSREAARMAGDLESWLGGIPVEPEKAELLSLVAGLVALPLSTVDLQVEKDAALAEVRKMRLVGEFMALELTAAGRYGVNVFTKGSGPYAKVLRVHQEPDMRIGIASALPAYHRFLRAASFRALRLLASPVYALRDARVRREPEVAQSPAAGASREYLPN